MTDVNRHREPVRYELVAEPEEIGSAESTITAIHRRLRGRYHVAAAAGLVFAGLAATAGWHASRPTFESRGLVRIDPVPATTMHDPDSLPVPSLMQAYVAEQSTILGGRTVVEQAVADPLLRAAGWPSGDRGVAALEGSLEIVQPRGQNILNVSVSSPEPTRARAAVDAVLRAYQEQAAGPAERERSVRLTSLESRRAELIDRIEALEAEQLEASRGTGPELVERMHVTRVEELIAIDRQIDDLRARRTAIKTGDDPAAAAAATGAIDRPAGDPQRQRLIRQRDEIRARIDSMSDRYGPRHPIIRELEAELETVRIRIAALDGTGIGPLTGGVPERLGPGDGIDVGGPGDALAGLALDEEDLVATGGLTALERIDNLIARAEERKTAVHDEIADLSRRRVAINTLADRIEDAQVRLSNVERRIGILSASSDLDSTGVTIATWGDLPVSPARDRRAQLAIAGGLAGGFFGVVAVIGLGSINPRIRYTDDLSFVPGAPAVAAILPDMASGGAAAEARSTRGVHHLRSIIELDTVRPDRNVVAVTGCTRGEGRTSTALALATGLARSGRRTLVIDGDITSPKLTRELVLDDEPGLVEALGVDPSEGRVHETGEPGLWALPMGLRGVHGEEVLSRPRLVWLLDTLRTRFDAIVIDTGPMLASSEGPTFAGVADRTVLVVERGVRASAVRAALDRLRQVSARCVGLVVNRADDADFRDLEVGGSTPTRRGRAMVETRPSALAPSGRPSSLAALGGAPAVRRTRWGDVPAAGGPVTEPNRDDAGRPATTTTTGRTAA